MPAYAKREVPRKKFICKFCKVQVISKFNFAPIWGQEHKKSCPRKRFN